MTIEPTAGESRELPLHRLRLDPHNPRLPADLQGSSQADLAVHLELGFDAYTVAESIWFASNTANTSSQLICLLGIFTPILALNMRVFSSSSPNGHDVCGTRASGLHSPI